MATNNIKEVDSNMLKTTLDGEVGIIFHDIRKAPFKIYGLYKPETESVFKRMPDEVGLNVNKGVARHYICTAGGRVRFSTDSRHIVIRTVMPYEARYDHMPRTNVCGFDLYEDTSVGSRFVGTFRPGTADISHGYEAVINLPDSCVRSLTINFPSYNPVSSLEIGLDADSTLGDGARYRTDKPIVYYGSSITQGGCASRPGNTYESIISRRLGLDYINLGFSGNALAEESIVEYMSGLDMLVFVSDYDHNARSVEYLADTHCRMYKMIREKHPDIPYIMLSRPDFQKEREQSILRRNVIIDTYRYALSQGDKNVYYIDGESLFRGPDEDSCTVDGTHPTDLGFAKMAEAIECELRRALRNAQF
ncbi:MAG: SGNH/GDSL hydrolase family protein [Clostridia bacterium]|nr:SGNH/GDSL hydrolase family protein [Clostridia bacterium]